MKKTAERGRQVPPPQPAVETKTMALSGVWWVLALVVLGVLLVVSFFSSLFSGDMTADEVARLESREREREARLELERLEVAEEGAGGSNATSQELVAIDGLAEVMPVMLVAFIIGVFVRVYKMMR